jgi:hypothetical protein
LGDGGWGRAGRGDGHGRGGREPFAPAPCPCSLRGWAGRAPAAATAPPGRGGSASQRPWSAATMAPCSPCSAPVSCRCAAATLGAPQAASSSAAASRTAAGRRPPWSPRHRRRKTAGRGPARRARGAQRTVGHASHVAAPASKGPATVRPVCLHPTSRPHARAAGARRVRVNRPDARAAAAEAATPAAARRLPNATPGRARCITGAVQAAPGASTHLAARSRLARSTRSSRTRWQLDQKSRRSPLSSSSCSGLRRQQQRPASGRPRRRGRPRPPPGTAFSVVSWCGLWAGRATE